MAQLSETEAAGNGFSLVLGGPLFQLFRRAHLCDDTMHLLRQRITVFILLCWVPLLVLSAIGGHLLPGSAAVPFLYDIDAHVRFLIALPLLILAELMVHQRLGALVRLFTDRDLIPAKDMPRFDAARESALWWRNSFAPELVLLAIVYAVAMFGTGQRLRAPGIGTWYVGPAAAGSELTLAGKWYAFVSLPVFQFLLLRWYFRLFIWARFLWQVARIRLQLVPTHPDRAGGLGFLGATGPAFGLLLMGQGALVSGQLANRIFFLGAQLTEFKYEILMYVVFMLLAVTLPLAAFVPQMARAKRRGRAEYGNLANRYMREFDTKWMRGQAPAEEPFIGSADIQSLADMGNSYSVVQEMSLFPMARPVLFQLAALSIIPLLPLLLTVMPLEELLKKLFGVLL